tara:strand:- start:4041 stop:4556 length:516 start_codon:yes stop_codon:yes gene_type:complete
MVGSKLKHHFIKKKIDKLSKNLSMKGYGASQKINSVAIITLDDSSKQHDFQEILIQNLQLRNPRIYSFRKFAKEDEKSYKHFSEKDFDWKGQIIESSLQSFLEEPFDLLICFFSKKNQFLEYAAIKSSATFKIGFSGINSNLFDIELASDISQVDVFFDEVKKYLKILNKL